MIRRQIRTYSKYKIFSTITGYHEGLRPLDLESVEYLHKGEPIPEGGSVKIGPRGGRILARRLSPTFIWKPITDIPDEVITVWGNPTLSYTKQVTDRDTGDKIRRDFYAHPPSEYDPHQAFHAFGDTVLTSHDEDLIDMDALTITEDSIMDDTTNKILTYDDGKLSGLITYKRFDDAICIESLGAIVEKKGIGVDLINAMVDHARRLGCKTIFIENAKPSAQDFYLRLGFKRSNHKDAHENSLEMNMMRYTGEKNDIQRPITAN